MDPNKDPISLKGENGRSTVLQSRKKLLLMQKDIVVDFFLADFKSMKRGFENGVKPRLTSKV